jgi:hypothetical protein
MPTVFHIGYHKTASTWLQSEVFTNIDGRTWTGTRGLVDAALRDLARADDRHYSPGVLGALRDDLVARDDRPVLFSYEGMSGRLWHADDTGTRSLERIARLEPEASILLLVREQQSMLGSIYFQYLYEGGTLGPESFCVEPSGPGWRFAPEHLAYDRLVRLAIDLFGPDRVCVLPYELLTSDSERFLDHLGQFLGVSIDRTRIRFQRTHESPSAPSLRLLVHWNRAFRSSELSRSPSIANLRLGRRPARLVRAHLDPRLRRLGATNLDLSLPPRWDQLYRASNAELDRICGHDLAALGYRLPSARARS